MPKETRLKPCPLCGGKKVYIQGHGIECISCGLWFGGGTRAVDRWRELRKDPVAIPEDGWLVEVWNARP